LLHDYLTERGLRERSEITLVMPLGVPIPPSPAASAALLAAFAQRGITWRPGSLVRELVPGRNVAVLETGEELPFDLFLGVPVHRAPVVVQESGLCVDGWIPVDPGTLATAFADVYAVGDVASVGTPKAGVFAEGQAAVVADALIARVRGGEALATYDGRGQCYLAFGADQVAIVDVTFRLGEAPVGSMEGPSPDLVARKAAFGASRIERWFGREWQPLAAADVTT
jgi:sulfide:quinone oxidoreductase